MDFDPAKVQSTQPAKPYIRSKLCKSNESTQSCHHFFPSHQPISKTLRRLQTPFPNHLTFFKFVLPYPTFPILHNIDTSLRGSSFSAHTIRSFQYNDQQNQDNNQDQD